MFSGGISKTQKTLKNPLCAGFLLPEGLLISVCLPKQELDQKATVHIKIERAIDEWPFAHLKPDETSRIS